LTDLQCALGLSQLARLQDLVAARAALTAAYDRALEPLAPIVRTPPDPLSARPAWHLYSVRIDFAGLRRDRASVIRSLAGQGIGAQVHYIPVYRQPYYAARYGAQSLPGAERHYQETLSLPLFPGMTAEDIGRVAGALRRALGL
jgi:dTDP-4-amino-4,6-dideoxygalactose transaminase